MMNLKVFDLNLLRVLDAMLTERSTVKAGARIGLSQPAVSNALARLRVALGDPLFVRQGQKLVPTDFAASLELPLARTLDDLELILSGPARFDPLQATNAFKIGGSDFFSEMLMPDLARSVATSAPNIKIQLVDLVPDDFIATLEAYGADLALIPKVDLPDWLEGEPVFHSSFAMIARRDHPRLAKAGLRVGDTIPLDLFCALGHVVFSPQGHLRAMGDAALDRLGRERRVVMTLPVMGGVANAVAGSDLVAILAEQLAVSLAPRLGLAVYRLPMDVGRAQIWMIWHRRSSGNPGHRWLRGIVRDVLRRLDGLAIPDAASGFRPDGS